MNELDFLNKEARIASAIFGFCGVTNPLEPCGFVAIFVN